MNKKKTKRIQAQAAVILVDWLRSLLNEEEGLKITTKNCLNFMPKQTHFMAERTMYLNAYHPKWIKNKIKRLLVLWPDRAIESITLKDIQWIAKS